MRDRPPSKVHDPKGYEEWYRERDRLREEERQRLEQERLNPSKIKFGPEPDNSDWLLAVLALAGGAAVYWFLPTLIANYWFVLPVVAGGALGWFYAGRGSK